MLIELWFFFLALADMPTEDDQALAVHMEAEYLTWCDALAKIPDDVLAGQWFIRAFPKRVELEIFI